MPNKAKRKNKSTNSAIKKRKFNLFFFRGDAAISFLVLVVVAIGSFMLVGGITPKLNKQDFNNVVVLDTPPPATDADNTLQLKTFKFKKCADTTAIHFLLDTSGSMGFNNGKKIQNLQNAVRFFASNLSDSSVAGLRRFSADTTLPVEINIKTRSKIISAVARLEASGGTYTKDAFTAAKIDIKKALDNQKFKKYNFNLIFFSDGIPETTNKNNSCPGFPPPNEFCTNPASGSIGCRCFDSDQNPITTTNEIKSLKDATGKNIRIFSILLFDPARDAYFATKFKPLMKNIASPNSYFETTDETQLKEIFSQINQIVCN